jgi:hypothetical protein
MSVKKHPLNSGKKWVKGNEKETGKGRPQLTEKIIQTTKGYKT